MRILIFSDNHGDQENLRRVIKKIGHVDRIFSLGDSEMRDIELTLLNVVGVKGNYPFEPKFPYELSFVFHDQLVFLTHGHLYHVKLGLSSLVNHADNIGAKIVCFGHTHRPLLEVINDIIFVNPGALANKRSGDNPSYGIIEITEEETTVVIKNVYDNIIKELRKKHGKKSS